VAVLGSVVAAAAARRSRPGPALVTTGDGVLEVTTVADDEAVLFDGTEVVHYVGLEPDTEYEHDGVSFRTLPRPPGERLATFATVNDVHFGETECGYIEGLELGPILRTEPGEPPYPETMNRAAADEIAAIGPAAVVVKGDLTSGGSRHEFDAFLAVYGRFGDRLHYIDGNHDAYHGPRFTDGAPIEVALPGAILAIVDTVVPGSSGGGFAPEQADWLDELAARADRPVLVFGHHHCWSPESSSRAPTYFGIAPDDSERLVGVFGRRPALCGYFAGHTHRNRVRRFAVTGDVPYVEVASVKDFPGTWAEYRVFEGGVLQIHRRIAAPDALAWSERCRSMFGGLYPLYAFGALEDRCFVITPR
jgi:predicted phosphodiesterase